VFAHLITHDATRFYPSWGFLPGVVGVRDATGAWDAAGQTRTLLLSDGGSVRETLREVTAPLFAYDLSRFTGVFGALVASARAEWRVLGAGPGSTIAWTYSFTAKPGRGALVAAIVSLAWGPYMRRVLPAIAASAAVPA